MALIDLETLEDGAVLEADLCIVGAGVAGIAIARHFIGSGVQVLLLEGGGWDPSSESQAIYQGTFGTCYQDDSYEEQYLSISRLRYFGGTSNHWAGWCRPMTP